MCRSCRLRSGDRLPGGLVWPSLAPPAFARHASGADPRGPGGRKRAHVHRRTPRVPEAREARTRRATRSWRRTGGATSTTTPTRPTPTDRRAAGTRHRSGLDVHGRRMCASATFDRAGPHRHGLRRGRGAAARDVRPADARAAGRVPASAAQPSAGGGDPFTRLLRRRLLLPRRPGPRGDPDQPPPHLGRRGDRRSARPGFQLERDYDVSARGAAR